MLKSNFINLLGIFAALALSSLLLARTAERPEAESAVVGAAESAVGEPVVIKSYPADSFVIEALPPE
jgi:hypothetical protein